MQKYIDSVQLGATKQLWRRIAGSSWPTWDESVGNVEPGEVIFVVRRKHDPHLVRMRINDVVVSLQEAAMCEQQIVVSIIITVEYLKQLTYAGARKKHDKFYF